MENSLSIIKQVIEEHGSIREHLKTAGDTINELESIQSLQKIRRDGPPNQIEILPDKLRELQCSLQVIQMVLCASHHGASHTWSFVYLGSS